MKRWLILLCLATVMLAARPAGAQDAAQDHVRTARELVAQQKFAEAAAELELAYSSSHDPELLYEMAWAYRLAGNKAKAIDLYQRYLAVAPDGDKSRNAYDWIENLTTGATHQSRAPEPRKPSKPADTGEPTERQREDAERQAGARQAEAEARQAEAEKQRSERAAWEAAHPGEVERFRAKRKRLRTTGLIVGGIGAVALGTGIIFGIIAKGQADEVSSATKWSADLQDTDESGQTNGTISVIGISVGSAALLTGGILYYLGARGGQVPMESAALVVPTVGAHAAGFAIGGRF